MKRRSFIKQTTLTAFSVAVYGSIHWNGKSFEGNDITTTDILGPYYRPGAPMRSNLVPAGSTAANTPILDSRRTEGIDPHGGRLYHFPGRQGGI